MAGKLFVAAPLVLVISLAAFAPQTSPTAAQPGDAEVRQLLLLMDKDKNGKVSREEFMSFMSAEFDRLDVNKDGELDLSELSQLRVAPKHPGGGSK